MESPRFPSSFQENFPGAGEWEEVNTLCPTGFIPPLMHNLFKVEDWLLNVSSGSFECIFLFSFTF